MLIGFFPIPSEAKARIIKYVDRIWLDEHGIADVVRRFIIQLDKNSPQPLTGIRMLLPIQEVIQLEDWGDTKGIDPGWYFNQIFSTKKFGGGFQVVEKIETTRPGKINLDLIEDVLCFQRADEHHLYAQKKGRISCITYQFPEVPLRSGGSGDEKAQVLLHFSTKHIFQRQTADTDRWVYFGITLSYFDNDSPEAREALSEFTDHSSIQIATSLDPKTLNDAQKTEIFPGGFDIFCYLPREYYPERDSFSKRDYLQESDYHLNDGSLGQYPREKLIWRLRKERYPRIFYPADEVPFVIRGVIRPVLFTAFEEIRRRLEGAASEINSTSTQIGGLTSKLGNMTSEITNLSTASTSTITSLRNLLEGTRSAVKLAYIALVVTLVGLITTVVIFLIQSFSR